MFYSNNCINAMGNLPEEFPLNLIRILNPDLEPDNQVTVFVDDQVDPHFADLYSGV